MKIPYLHPTVRPMAVLGPAAALHIDPDRTVPAEGTVAAHTADLVGRTAEAAVRAKSHRAAVVRHSHLAVAGRSLVRSSVLVERRNPAVAHKVVDRIRLVDRSHLGLGRNLVVGTGWSLDRSRLDRMVQTCSGSSNA